MFKCLLADGWWELESESLRWEFKTFLQGKIFSHCCWAVTCVVKLNIKHTCFLGMDKISFCPQVNGCCFWSGCYLYLILQDCGVDLSAENKGTNFISIDAFSLHWLIVSVFPSWQLVRLDDLFAYWNVNSALFSIHSAEEALVSRPA